MSGPSVYLEMGELFFCNGRKLGYVIQDVDGYKKFFPTPQFINGGGYVDSYVLRDIADLIDAINKEWDDVIQNDPALRGETTDAADPQVDLGDW